jgi:hypothetical protein
MTTLTVRPITFTTVPDAWLAVLHALGGKSLVDDDDWHVVAFASGRVAVHAVRQGDPLAGTQVLGFETDDVDAVAAATGRPVDVDADGPGIAVTGADGLSFRIHAATPDEDVATGAAQPTTAQPTAVLPLWYSPDVADAVATLERLGLRRRIASDAGTWVDLAAPDGGLVAAHRAERSSVQISFEHPDVRALAVALEAAGVGSTVVDENYGFSLRVPNPDAAIGAHSTGSEIFVNQTQRDLYGYTPA